MEIKYQNRIIAFIDVLGFSNIVYSESINSLNKYYDYIFSNFQNAVKSYKFSYTLISDSIVISAKFTKENFHNLITTICITQAQLLKEGILFRGAISSGNFFVNKSKNIIVGPGLINAYKLEANAIYPRVIIDKSLIGYFYDGLKDAIHQIKYDGFTPFELLLFDPPTPYHRDFPYINYIRFIGVNDSKIELQKVFDFLNANYYKNEHTVKYEWLAKHILENFIYRIDILQNKIDRLNKLTNSNMSNLKRIKRTLKRYEEFYGKVKNL